MRRRAGLILMILGIVVGVVMAGTAEITLRLVMWTYGVETVADNIAKFEAMYPGINVEVEDISWYVYPETLAMRFITGDAPDVLYVNDPWLVPWAEAGWLVALEDFFPGLAETYGPLMKRYVRESVMHNDKIWGLPYYADTYVLMVNTDHLAAAGIAEYPTTWDELLEQSILIKNLGITPHPYIGEFHQDEHSLTNVIFSKAYSIEPYSMFDDDLNPLFAYEGSALYQALDWLRRARFEADVFDPASLALKEIDVYKAMQGGRGTFTIMEKYTLGELNAPGTGPHAGNFDLMLMPETGVTVGSAKFYGMTAQAAARGPEVVEAIGKLIEYLGGGTDDYAVTRRWAVEHALGFGYTHLYEDPQIQASIDTWGNYEVEKAQEVLAIQMQGIEAPWFAEWSTFLRLEIHRLMTGKPVMQVVNDLAREWTDLMADY